MAVNMSPLTVETRKRAERLTEGPSKTKALFSFNNEFRLAKYWDRVLVSHDAQNNSNNISKKKSKQQKDLTSEGSSCSTIAKGTYNDTEDDDDDDYCDSNKTSREDHFNTIITHNKWSKYVNRATNKVLYFNEETGEVRKTNPAYDNEAQQMRLAASGTDMGPTLRCNNSRWTLSDKLGSSLRCKLGVSYTSYLSSPLSFVKPFERGLVGLSPSEVVSESFSLQSVLEQMPHLWQVDNVLPSVHKWLLVGIRFVDIHTCGGNVPAGKGDVTMSLWHNKKKLWEDVHVDSTTKAATTSYTWGLFGPLKRTLTSATLHILHTGRTSYSHSALDLSFTENNKNGPNNTSSSLPGGTASTHATPLGKLRLPPPLARGAQTSRQYSRQPQQRRFTQAQAQQAKSRPFFAARSHAVWLPLNSFPQTVYVPLEIGSSQVPVCVQLALYDREPSFTTAVPPSLPSPMTVTIPKNAAKLELGDLVPGADHRDDMYFSLDLERFVKDVGGSAVVPPSFAVYAHVVVGSRRTAGPVLVGFRTATTMHPLAECGKLLRARVSLCKKVLKSKDSCIIFEFVSTQSPAEYEERGFRSDSNNYVFAWCYFKFFKGDKLREFRIDAFPLSVFRGPPTKISVP